MSNVTYADKVDGNRVTAANMNEIKAAVNSKANSSSVSGTNTGDETTATIKTKLGITTLSGSNTGDQDLSGKQATLVSGTNIKTINGASILGSGDLTVTGGSGGDTLTTEGALINSATAKTTPVDADMVGLMDSAASNILKKLSWANIKATLKTYFDSLTTTLTNKTISGAANTISNISPSSITQDASNRFATDTEKTTWNGKQAALVSATNIKTINGASVLGSGDLTVTGGSGGDTLTTEGALISSATAKTTPVDADQIGLMDSAASNILKSLSWANIKASLKTYFDSVSTTLTNKIESFTAAHSADDTYNGKQITGLNAGATIAQWEAVYLGSSSTWLLADANGSSTYPARGLAVAAYSNTNAAAILVQGTVRNDAWAWTPGGTIYLSGTAGALTQTAPSTSGDKMQAIGYALTADIAYFDFNSTYLTIA